MGGENDKGANAERVMRESRDKKRLTQLNRETEETIQEAGKRRNTSSLSGPRWQVPGSVWRCNIEEETVNLPPYVSTLSEDFTHAHI